MVATGGTITTSGNDKIHKFTGPGTFTVCSVGSGPAESTSVDYVVTAGGAGGGPTNNGIQYTGSGGGGAPGNPNPSSGASGGPGTVIIRYARS